MDKEEIMIPLRLIKELRDGIYNLKKDNYPKNVLLYAFDRFIEIAEEEYGITKDKNIKNCENCGWWTCKDMNKRRCQYCYEQDEWIPDYDENNGVYKENITIKADEDIKSGK